MELIVTVLNINRGKNVKLMAQCRLLEEYMQYVEKIRKYAKKLPLKEAVEQAVTECIREEILRDFLTKNRKEAISVSIFEYDEEEALKYIREEEYRRGLDEGMNLGRQEGMNLGRQEGMEEGIRGMVKVLRGFGCEDNEIKRIISEQYEILAEHVEEYFV